MARQLIILLFFFGTTCTIGQYRFSGQLAAQEEGKEVYLSLIEDYRRTQKISFDQIIRKTRTDSLGRFSFEGDHLSTTNQLYRIHIDDCEATNTPNGHFLGNCSSNRSVLFPANNLDTLELPSTFANEIFCEVRSTNSGAGKILEIEALKEQMILDFTEVRSEASNKLNLKKWFGKWQDFGVALEDPLLELVIYSFLSDRANETYAYYLEEVGKNPYYKELLNRLQMRYPYEPFTAQYEKELQTDLLLADGRSSSSARPYWVLGILLGISVLSNVLLFIRLHSMNKNELAVSLSELTPQEKKIATLIKQNRTNKEIASELFISVSTVKTHINNLYKKMGVTEREDIKSAGLD